MAIRQAASRFVEKLGTKLKLPEFGISEAIASSPPKVATTSSRFQSPAPIQTPLPTQTPLPRPRQQPTPQPQPQPQQQPRQQPRQQPSGGLTADILRSKFGFNDPNVISSILNDPNQRARYETELGFGGGGGGGVPSAEERARESAEERMRRFRELVAPVQGDIEAYLKSRRPITELFQEQLTAQGIPQKQENLALLEGQVGTLGEQLSTLPGEEIERRQKTGLISAAAERRIRALEERPIREQLLKTTTAAGAERVGLQRAFQLVDKYLDVIREEEQRQLDPLQFRLKGAQAEFGEEVEALATRLTGFNDDRKAKLRQYEELLDQQFKLTTAQNKEAADLRRDEAKHLNKLEEIAAREKGEAPQFTDPDKIEAFKVDIRGGMNEAQITEKWRNLVPLETLEWLLKEYARVIPSGGGGGNLERPE